MLEALVFSSDRNGFSLHVSSFVGVMCRFFANLDAVHAVFLLLCGALK